MFKKYLPLVLLFTVLLAFIAAPRAVKSNEESISNNLLTPYLVKDINQRGISSNPHELTDVNGTLFFVSEHGDDFDHSLELWKSDGTESGTELVKLFNSDEYYFGIRHLTAVNNTLFFEVYDPNETDRYQLWTSNGTEAGTVQIKASNDAIMNKVALNGVFYFIYNNSNSSSYYGDGTLWRSDGTLTGTYALSNAIVDLDKLEISNNNLYFIAHVNGSSSGLWRSDGTLGGTNFLKNIGNIIRNFTDVNGTLFFTGVDALYKSDGTEAGTTLVKDLPPNYEIDQLVNINGSLFFSAYDDTHGFELWRSDGTDAGTEMVKDINPGTSNSNPTNIINVNGLAFFFVDGAQDPYELWKSDGTNSGTTLVRDNFDRIYPLGDYYGQTMANLNGMLVFRGADGTQRGELWVSNGTTSGTTMIKDFYSDIYETHPTEFTVMNNTLYFAADSLEGGVELWRSNGTTASTYQVKNINEMNDGSFPEDIVILNDKILFGAYESTYGRELWESDGTSLGTSLLKNIGIDDPDRIHNGNPQYMETVGSHVFFAGNGGLWMSDGTSENTRLIKESPGWNPQWGITGLDDNDILFLADHNEHGRSLWFSDRTADGTYMIKDFWPSSSGDPEFELFDVVNGNLFFSVEGNELWKSDGTEAGTLLLKEYEEYSDVSDVTVYNGEVFFNAEAAGYGDELWKSDGTIAGTTLVVDIVPGEQSGYPGAIIVHNNTLYFGASDRMNNRGLWKSDGTAAGTELIVNINSGYKSAFSYPASINGMLYFCADDGTHGRELWKSDGTAAGTVQIADLSTGSTSSTPHGFTEYNNQIFFFADDGIHGYQVWVTDGTSLGTNRLTDLQYVRSQVWFSDYYGYYYFPKRGFYKASGKLFFVAEDNTTGEELWAFDALNPTGNPNQDEAIYLPMIVNP